MRGQTPLSEIESGGYAASGAPSGSDPGSSPQTIGIATGGGTELCFQSASQNASSQRSERRKGIRHAIEEACVMTLLRQGGGMACTILDLGLDGCKIRTSERFGAGIQVRVEVSFKVNGVAFRFNGVTRWTDGRNLAGIAFVDMLPRRREALAEVLAEVDEAQAAKADRDEAGRPEADQAAQNQAAQNQAAQEAVERQARERAAQELERLRAASQEAARQEAARQEVARREAAETESRERAERNAAERAAREQALREAAQPQEHRHGNQAPAQENPGAAAAENAPEGGTGAARPAPFERRAQQRHPVDTTAVIHMIRAGARLQGRIQDLSAGGCRIRTGEPFPVGIYTRVETEFHVQGLPFRLGGVVQSIHDRGRFLVGIRFLDVSPRKREQLEQLIAELNELAERQRTAENRE